MDGGGQASDGSARTATVFLPHESRQWPGEGVGPMSPHVSCASQSAKMEGHSFSTSNGFSRDLASGPAVLNPEI